MALAPIVELFRKANRPSENNGVFSSRLALSADVIKLITSARALLSHSFQSNAS